MERAARAAQAAQRGRVGQAGKPGREGEGRSVAVVVMGDIGRSPRMQYHAISLASHSFHVDVVGYVESPLHPDLHALVASGHVHVHGLRKVGPASAFTSPVGYLLAALLKVVVSLANLLWVLLCKVRTPSHILVQNPPAMPSLVAAHIASLVLGAVFVVDWHNFAFSIVALAQPGRVVRVARWYEGVVGRRARRGFCVSRAMQRELSDMWGVSAVVVHDRAYGTFTRTSDQDRVQLFGRLGNELAPLNRLRDPNSPLANPARELGKEPGCRPLLFVSSTSWTPDEDFSVLLDAIVQCDAEACRTPNFPNIVVVITGKGPQKAQYVARMQALELGHFALTTAWLQPDDYPRLLGSADLGISLHTSSSGVDLPMKVVDMFGCALPVCAMRFACIDELVEANTNGLLFSSSSELASQLFSLSRDPATLQRLANGAARFQKRRWHHNWDANALPVFA